MVEGKYGYPKVENPLAGYTPDSRGDGLQFIEQTQGKSQQTESEKLTELEKPTEQEKPTEPEELIEPEKLIEQGKPTEPEEPTELKELTETEKPTGSLTDSQKEDELNEEVLDIIDQLQNVSISSTSSEAWVDGTKVVTQNFDTNFIRHICKVIYVFYKSLYKDRNQVEHTVNFEDVNLNLLNEAVDLEFKDTIKLELDTTNFGDLITSVRKATDKMADIEISLANFYDSFSFDENNESNAVTLAVNSLRVATKKLAEDSALIRQNLIDAKLDSSDINQSVKLIKDIIDAYHGNVKNSLQQVTDAYSLIKTNTEFVNQNFTTCMNTIESNSTVIQELYGEIEKTYEALKIQHAYVANDLKQVSQVVIDLKDSIATRNLQDQTFREKVLKMFLYFGIGIMLLILVKMILGVVM